MGRLLFSVSNHHTERCGEPPIIDGDAQGKDAQGKYVGYFVNEYGEQAIYMYDFETGEATLKMGDAGWQATYAVIDGKVDGLLLNKAGLMWLRACWIATGELRQRRQSGEEARPTKA